MFDFHNRSENHQFWLWFGYQFPVSIANRFIAVKYTNRFSAKRNPWNAHKVPLTQSKQMRGWNNKSNTSHQCMACSPSQNIIPFIVLRLFFSLSFTYCLFCDTNGYINHRRHDIESKLQSDTSDFNWTSTSVSKISRFQQQQYYQQ